MPVPWERGGSDLLLSSQLLAHGPGARVKRVAEEVTFGGQTDSSITSRQRAPRHPPNAILDRNKADCCFSVSSRALSRQSPLAYA